MNWKEFMGSQPERKVVHIYGDLDISIKLKELSWQEKMDALNQRSEDIVMKNDKEKGVFFLGVQETSVNRVGKNFFKTQRWLSYYRFEGRKMKSLNPGTYCSEIYSMFDITWSKELFQARNPSYIRFLGKPAIFKKVLKREIYSEENLWKAVETICFRAKQIPWRAIKSYCDIMGRCNCPRLEDLICFTTNPSLSIQALVEQYHDANFPLMCDLVKSAVILDEVVNLRWSTRRMREEHDRQIKEINAVKIESLDNAEIQESRIENENIAMLNTEKEVYMEGQRMNHCVYSCYYKDIKKHLLLAFHMSYPEDCTFAVEKNEQGMPSLQQIHRSHNGCVRNETRQLAVDFISNNTEYMSKMLDIKQDRLPF